MRIGILLGCALFALAYGTGVVPAAADSISLAWAANSCGGERMAGNSFIAVVNVGQLTIGDNASGQRMASLGVLSAEQPPPFNVASTGVAKLQPDGARLALGGLVVTSDPGVFSDRIYAQAPDRSSGIALVGGRGEAALALEGCVVNVVGGVSTVNGERVVLNPMLAVLNQDDTPLALGMVNRSVGGTGFGVPPLGQKGVVGGEGLNNIGLLIRTAGLVIDDSHAEYILINDGSWSPIWESGLKIAKYNLSPVPEIGSYVVVNGISTVRVRGSVLDAIVKPRKAGDLDVLMPPAPSAWMNRALGRRER